MFGKLISWYAGRVTPGYTKYHEAKAIYDRYANLIGLQLDGQTDDQLAVARINSDLARAKQLYIEALGECRKVNAIYNIAAIHAQLGMLCHLRGESDEAKSNFERALDLFDDTLNRHWSVQDAQSACHVLEEKTTPRKLLSPQW